MSMEDICKYLGVDSLGYLDVEGMVRADRKAIEQLLPSPVFNGDYPLPVDPALDKFIMEKNASSVPKRCPTRKHTPHCSPT